MNQESALPFEIDIYTPLADQLKGILYAFRDTEGTLTVFREHISNRIIGAQLFLALVKEGLAFEIDSGQLRESEQYELSCNMLELDDLENQEIPLWVIEELDQIAFENREDEISEIEASLKDTNRSNYQHAMQLIGGGL